MAGSRPFKAKYSGRCSTEACRLGGIAEGDVVVYTDDGDLVHEACAATADEPDPLASGKVCPTCHLVHAGECF